MLSLIAVIGKNRELGKDNGLILEVPGDLPRFKKLTMGHPVVMGRKTYESIPEKYRPLKGRTNVVVTSDPSQIKEGVVVVDTIDKALEAAFSAEGREEVFVIGGGQVFAQTVGKADRLYLTVVDAEPEADTFFPEYGEFGKVVSVEEHEAGGLKFRYEVREKGR